MKIKNVLSLIAFLIFGLTVSYGCTPVKQTTTNAPSLHFDQVSYNFGRIPKGQKVSHNFTFTNTGNEKLVITKVQPTCGCTVAITSSKELLPGAKGIIKITFDSQGYLGPITKTITVMDNDPAKPSVLLSISGDVVTDVMLSKPALFFGSIKKGQGAQQSVDIFISNPSVHIMSVVSTNPYIKVSTVSQFMSQETINVSVLPDAGYGPLNADILILSSSKEQPSLHIPVIGNIVGDILLNPDVVDFGVVKAHAEQRILPVYLYTQPPREFSLTKVTVKPDIVHVKVLKQNQGSYKLELLLKPVKSMGSIHGTITVLTTMKKMPVVVIPFQGTIEP
ncbi:MAG: DUF1573 domain-containing protein [Deltaproteobacteria bacterium]|nr:DUF1573 domain-containing protein [Deltaproteobacteria bacterium]